MIRTLFATAGVAIAAATLAAPAAQACLSCEYKPEVLGSSSTDSKPQKQKRARVDAAVKARKAKPAKDYAEDRKAARARKAAAAEDRRDRARAAASEKAAAEKATVATGSSTEPAATSSHSVYNTLIKTTEPVDKASPAASAETKVEPVKVEPAVTAPSDSGIPAKPKSSDTIDTADVTPSTTDVVAAPTTTAAAPDSGEAVTVKQEKGSKETGCKKFFPMADLTLTVDCK
ncbi:MAG: hypothetical protein Q7T86_10275 [Hyphomicrobiaceae bacterium]|nr:hypothetical protein [Hyphomicrobiaceae bacterium]